MFMAQCLAPSSLPVMRQPLSFEPTPHNPPPPTAPAFRALLLYHARPVAAVGKGKAANVPRPAEIDALVGRQVSLLLNAISSRADADEAGPGEAALRRLEAQAGRLLTLRFAPDEPAGGVDGGAADVDRGAVLDGVLERDPELLPGLRVVAGPGGEDACFLQLRPLSLTRETEVFELGEVDPEAILCRSERVLGNGRLEGIRDLVVVAGSGSLHAYSLDDGALRASITPEGSPLGSPAICRGIVAMELAGAGERGQSHLCAWNLPRGISSSGSSSSRSAMRSISGRLLFDATLRIASAAACAWQNFPDA